MKSKNNNMIFQFLQVTFLPIETADIARLYYFNQPMHYYQRYAYLL